MVLYIDILDSRFIDLFIVRGVSPSLARKKNKFSHRAAEITEEKINS